MIVVHSKMPATSRSINSTLNQDPNSFLSRGRNMITLKHSLEMITGNVRTKEGDITVKMDRTEMESIERDTTQKQKGKSTRHLHF